MIVLPFGPRINQFLKVWLISLVGTSGLRETNIFSRRGHLQFIQWYTRFLGLSIGLPNPINLPPLECAQSLNKKVILLFSFMARLFQVASVVELVPSSNYQGRLFINGISTVEKAPTQRQSLWEFGLHLLLPLCGLYKKFRF